LALCRENWAARYLIEGQFKKLQDEAVVEVDE
jgi:hypothetical protein